jgi:hypothetical protein
MFAVDGLSASYSLGMADIIVSDSRLTASAYWSLMAANPGIIAVT